MPALRGLLPLFTRHSYLAARPFSKTFSKSYRVMSSNCERRLYKIVLTGGPCGGKTTGLDRLATFFEKIGWKVFRVPETPTIILSGGVKFEEVKPCQELKFQEDMLMTQMKIEDTYFHLGTSCKKDCLIICDRGTMDPCAYIEPEKWKQILENNELNPVELRDNRYNQVVHMVTAADGAEAFYTLATNKSRSETPELALQRDAATRKAWLGHPYLDIVSNEGCANFDEKILKLIKIVCYRMGIQYGDRLEQDSRKRKWLVRKIIENKVPEYQEFDVLHMYLRVDQPNVQSRIRKRGQHDHWSYTSTIRQNIEDEMVETRRQITKREYEALEVQRDPTRCPIVKKRRCFTFNHQYFQLDIYVLPLPPQAPNPEHLMILETYTTEAGNMSMPDWLEIEKEITGNPLFSMYNLAHNKKS